MYTNKFKGSTNLSTTIILSAMVAAIHVVGYGVLTSNDDFVPTVPSANTLPAPSLNNIDTITVTATRLPGLVK
jgi:hypothetical protein